MDHPTSAVQTLTTYERHQPLRAARPTTPMPWSEKTVLVSTRASGFLKISPGIAPNDNNAFMAAYGNMDVLLSCPFKVLLTNRQTPSLH